MALQSIVAATSSGTSNSTAPIQVAIEGSRPIEQCASLQRSLDPDASQVEIPPTTYMYMDILDRAPTERTIGKITHRL